MPTPRSPALGHDEEGPVVDGVLELRAVARARRAADRRGRAVDLEHRERRRAKLVALSCLRPGERSQHRGQARPRVVVSWTRSSRVCVAAGCAELCDRERPEAIMIAENGT